MVFLIHFVIRNGPETTRLLEFKIRAKSILFFSEHLRNTKELKRLLGRLPQFRALSEETQNSLLPGNQECQ